MIYTLRRMRFRAMRTRLRAPWAWILHRGLTAEDVFIASYPRSGSHWLKFQLLEILTGQPADFDNVKQLMPKVGDQGVPGAVVLQAMDLVLPAQAPAILPQGGRIIHTHERYRREYKKAIYLVRDVRNVVLSEYAQGQVNGGLRYYNLSDFDSFLEPFMNGKIDRYGTWQSHVESWLESSLMKNGNLLIIRFEDLRRNTEDLLARIVDFLGIRTDQDVIRRAIANNTVERMRAKEDSSKVVVRGPGEDGRFVRRGTVAGWRERLTDAQVQLIERYAGATLARMGYSLGTPATHESGCLSKVHADTASTRGSGPFGI